MLPTVNQKEVQFFLSFFLQNELTVDVAFSNQTNANGLNPRD